MTLGSTCIGCLDASSTAPETTDVTNNPAPRTAPNAKYRPSSPPPDAENADATSAASLPNAKSVTQI
jgi:hypothetical protein